MKALWWTCGCGEKNVTREAGTPACKGCGKLAKFHRGAPQGQGGFDFGGGADAVPKKTGYEEDGV